ILALSRVPQAPRVLCTPEIVADYLLLASEILIGCGSPTTVATTRAFDDASSSNGGYSAANRRGSSGRGNHDKRYYRVQIPLIHLIPKWRQTWEDGLGLS